MIVTLLGEMMMDVVLPATLYDCYIVSMEKSVYLIDAFSDLDALCFQGK